MIGMHFMNPVPIMKLIEVINGSDTDAEVTEVVIEASEKWVRFHCVVTIHQALFPIAFYVQ